MIRNFLIVPIEYEFEKKANYILVGLRRSGKSIMLYRRVQELIENGVGRNQIIYINFEDDRLVEFNQKDFNDIRLVQSELRSQKGYYFFDEIQIVEGWEHFARTMADAKRSVYITGSNATMLGSEMEKRWVEDTCPDTSRHINLLSISGF